ncbi:Competence protein F homolog, phosphoribosyltransferase domain; protein YhgH required for utilization of DNA as sole source of carbon and energy [Olavius algarvensis associated proteobacterium Delta 3]|nr:Competence protein F homolog, phosphoribosyltransferase domain; protein YhgH required for utilization of DNA as sole source of carbon and energy [Olavius algarvensis associated proteobacterium Delta 3]CAB5084761.1 Competence protein F homolog, phosphoribosyltransferase domain; protein YhgH required for utilization of DNA as sole source of carbon and energy [Olavius algarvensis associated proteobacterium Delta 3]
MIETVLSATHMPFWKQLVTSIDEVLFPRQCIVCRSFLGSSPQRDRFLASGFDNHHVLSSYLCPDCFGQCRPLESPICPRCGRMFSSRNTGDHVCGECIGDRKPFHKARAWGAYEGALLRVVYSFKYHHKTFLARPLGSLMYAVLQRHWRSNEIDLVIPVPLHPKKLRQRGFNQSCLLIRHWPHNADWAAVTEPSTDWLVRTRWTRSQTGLRRKERRANICGAFSLQGRPPLASKNVLLIDDVYTTGATVAECARVLLDGGARRVDVLTLARAM